MSDGKVVYVCSPTDRPARVPSVTRTCSTCAVKVWVDERYADFADSARIICVPCMFEEIKCMFEEIK